MEAQEINEETVKGNLIDVTIQHDTQSLGDKLEPIDCPDILTDQSNDQSADDELICNHEIQVVDSSESETDLEKYRTLCTKNPGHKDFIAVGKFSIDHLPEDHRDHDLFQFIKATADLTVRVNVRMTSPNRPDVWQGTNVPYPFCNMRNSKMLRLGSGRLELVRKFTDGVYDTFEGFEPWKNSSKCWCKKCEISATPSNVWWEFVVVTATHVVFDENEASHASFRLFYDSDDSPVVSVDKVVVEDVSIQHDMCTLKCVTCDTTLGNRLENIWEHYDDVWGKVLNKYRKCRDVLRLTFIVSHPHGCPKQVSIGQWTDKYLVGDFLNTFTYTTCTCPGSSGAYVHCVGHFTGGWASGLVHSGSLKSGLNKSGGGIVR